jgi:hypothetical protein
MLDTLALPPAASEADTNASNSSFGASVEKLAVVMVFPDAWSCETCTSIAIGAGVMLLDGLDAGPVPAAFVAVTVNVYAVPFVNPGTVMGLADREAVIPPGFEVTV